MDHNLFQYLLGKVGYQMAGEVEPAEDDVVDATHPKTGGKSRRESMLVATVRISSGMMPPRRSPTI